MRLKKTDKVEVFKDINVTKFDEKTSFQEWFFNFKKVLLNGKKLNKKDSRYILSKLYYREFKILRKVKK